MIALDLDGTLFTEQKTVSSGNRRALAEARERGVEIMIASGRPLHNIPRDLLSSLDIHTVIACNGACVHRLPDGERIFEEPIDWEAAYELLRVSTSYPVMTCVLTDGATLIPWSNLELVNRPGVPEFFRNYVRSGFRPVEDVAAYLQEHNLPVYKFAIYFNFFSDKPEYYYDCLLKMIEADPRLIQVDGGGHSMEVTKSGVSKGRALHWLAEELGIPIAETMACGDTENDMEILKAAGIGVAMGNAAEHVKAVADYVTKTNEEDGVAYAIRHFLGMEEPCVK